MRGEISTSEGSVLVLKLNLEQPLDEKELWGSRGSECEDYCLLGCDPMQIWLDAYCLLEERAASICRLCV
jgi:hypothetical protein